MARVKRISQPDCSAPADKMVRVVLRTQLTAMCAVRGKALDWKDPAGVHNMRVLTRRLRSAISDFKPYLRKASLPHFTLRSIAKSLGAVRDEDVALAALEELKSRAKGPAAEGIEALAAERRKRLKEAQATLQKAIKQSALDEFRREFLTNLRATVILPPKKSGGKLADDTAVAFSDVGVDVIEARLRELSAASRHIYFPFEINEIHKLRILAKRLRYATEMFAVCWGEEMDGMAKEISLLQTSLGELHDCDVWIQSLGARLKKTARKDKCDEVNARLREGTTWLLRHFARERMEHYQDALARWQQWEADGFLNSLKSILTRNLFPAKRRKRVHS